MAIGNQVIGQSRLRPVRSKIVAAGNASNGVGVNYGMGIGSVRVAGVSYSIWDASQLYDLGTLSFVARVAILNGDYPLDATQFTVTSDLTAFDVLLDRFVRTTADFLPTWQSGVVTDDGQNCTALISQILFTGVAGGAPGPAGIQPQSLLILHGDHYRSRELALSPGSLFDDDGRRGRGWDL